MAETSVILNEEPLENFSIAELKFKLNRSEGKFGE